jgi:hypothetical protein
MVLGLALGAIRRFTARQFPDHSHNSLERSSTAMNTCSPLNLLLVLTLRGFLAVRKLYVNAAPNHVKHALKCCSPIGQYSTTPHSTILHAPCTNLRLIVK